MALQQQLERLVSFMRTVDARLDSLEVQTARLLRQHTSLAKQVSAEKDVFVEGCSQMLVRLLLRWRRQRLVHRARKRRSTDRVVRFADWLVLLMAQHETSV
jgi:hypothetical protein